MLNTKKNSPRCSSHVFVSKESLFDFNSVVFCHHKERLHRCLEQHLHEREMGFHTLYMMCDVICHLGGKKNKIAINKFHKHFYCYDSKGLVKITKICDFSDGDYYLWNYVLK